MWTKKIVFVSCLLCSYVSSVSQQYISPSDTEQIRQLITRTRQELQLLRQDLLMSKEILTQSLKKQKELQQQLTTVGEQLQQAQTQLHRAQSQLNVVKNQQNNQSLLYSEALTELTLVQSDLQQLKTILSNLKQSLQKEIAHKKAWRITAIVESILLAAAVFFMYIGGR